MKRQCQVPFCNKITPRSKDRFCSMHRNEFFIRKISPYKELPPVWAFRKCKVHGWQKFEDFYYNKANLSYTCKSCLLKLLKSKYCPIKRKQKLIREQQRTRNNDIKKKFGITQDQYLLILEKQDFKCAICSKLKSSTNFDIDHCHKTGKIRGLLCRSCNLGLGYFKDSPNLLNKAALYIDR